MSEQDDTAIGAAPAESTQFIPDAIRNASTPLAWEQADDDDVVDYPPTGQEQLFAPRSEPQSWRGTWGYAAGLLSIAVAVVLLILVVRFGGWTQPPDTNAAPSTVAAAAPVAPTRSPVAQIDDAFTETIDGKTVLAFQRLHNSADNFGTADQPLMQLLGTPDQRKDIVGKLAALGIDVGTNDQGVVTGLGFENEDAKKNWEVWWAEHSILPTVISAPTTAVTVQAAPPLDGTYRIDLEYSKETLNGGRAPGDLSNSSEWNAFRSACSPTGCSATGTVLDSQNLQAAILPAVNYVLHWTNGRWQADDRTDQIVCYTKGDYQDRHHTSVSTIMFVPQPGGSFSGTYEWTIRTNECGDSGETRIVPITATRTGPPPVGLVPDPPTG